VKNRFQNLPFKCNLQRYNTVLFALGQTRAALKRWRQSAEVGGLYSC
jgi:hypothetical protein